MSNINYKIDAEVRWAKLTKKINRMSMVNKRKLILAAKDYQSGEGLMNTVYMGSMEIAALCRAIGGKYGDGISYAEQLTKCSKKQIDDAIQVCMHTIEYMWAHPVGNCPCCGQIVSEGN
jgi:hypothetical protein